MDLNHAHQKPVIAQREDGVRIGTVVSFHGDGLGMNHVVIELDTPESSPSIKGSEENIWFEARTPDGWIWVETYSMTEFKDKIAEWEGPGDLTLERVGQRIDYYIPVRNKIEVNV